FDSLPASLLILNKRFEECVSTYTFSKATSHRYGTRWTFYFTDITFKSGIITEEPYKLAYDEPTLKVAETENETEVNKVNTTQQAQGDVNTFKEESKRPQQQQKSTSDNVFRQRRRI